LRNLEKEMVKIHDNLVIFYGFLGSWFSLSLFFCSGNTLNVEC
jgi:hypothetical protein